MVFDFCARIEGEGHTAESRATFVEFVTAPLPRIHLVSMADRPGTMIMSAMIEWTWFVPGSSTAHRFELRRVVWEDIPFLVMTFPRKKFPAIRSLAKRLGMRVADGVPTLLDHNGTSHFPGGRLPNYQPNCAMYSLENDSGSPIYQNNRRQLDEFYQCEGELIDALANTGGKLSVEQVVDYLYGNGPFPATR